MPLLYKDGVTLKLKNYECLAESIDCLDHVIFTGRFERAEYATDAVIKLKPPPQRRSSIRLWVCVAYLDSVLRILPTSLLRLTKS